MKATKEAILELRLVMALIPLIHANIHKVTTTVMMCNDLSLKSEATFYCLL